MVLPRPEGGFFTTEAPDRTYNTERGAKQAERMFQNPQRYQGWTRQGRQQEQPTIQEDIQEEQTNFDDYEDNFEEPDAEPLEDENPFIGWYELPQAVKDSIHDSPSSYHCIEELLSNGWTGVHLSSIVEDFGQSFADMFLSYLIL